MFAGMTSVLGIASSRVGGNTGLISITDWYTTEARGQTQRVAIVRRPGFNMARVTCISPGERENTSVFYQTYGTYYSGQGGNGGNCATSIVDVGDSTPLTAYFDPQHAYFCKDGINIVGASFGGISAPDNLGDVIFRGGRGNSYTIYVPNGNSYTPQSTIGGAAAGTFGDATDATVGASAQAGTRGACATWIDSSTGKTATNGFGQVGGVSDAQRDFGGGGGGGSPSGTRGLVAVEWGIRDLYI